MRHWLFQGNPDQFDVDAYMKSAERIYWSVSVKKYQREISLGDVVYLWRAQGKAKAVSGVVAKAVVIETCKPKDKLEHPTWLYDQLWMPESKEKSDHKVGLLVESYRLHPEDAMVTSGDFRSDTILSESNIIKVRVGSNFPLSADEAKRISQLWDLSDSDDFEVDEYGNNEGRILYRIHRIRERKAGLKKDYIAKYLKTHKALECELCGLKPEKDYGDLGTSLLELHHKTPLNKLTEERSTQLDDVMLVCPNCHRALHKGDAERNLELLKGQFRSGKTI